MLASYAPIGGGLALLCQLALAVPAALIVLSHVLGAPSRRNRPKYWIAFACVAQSIPVAFILVEIGSFSPCFDSVWLGSMIVLLIGILLVAFRAL
jgi:hypothetical protein